jgi:hypothetical protein
MWKTQWSKINLRNWGDNAKWHSFSRAPCTYTKYGKHNILVFSHFIFLYDNYFLPFRNYQKFHVPSTFRSNLAENVTQTVEHLPSKLEALNSHPSTAKRKKERKNKKGRKEGAIPRGIISVCQIPLNPSPTQTVVHAVSLVPSISVILSRFHVWFLSALHFVLCYQQCIGISFEYIYFLTTERYQEWVTITPLQSSSLSRTS